MSTVSRQDSFDSLDSYVSDDLLEAPTLSSKEIQRARDQALKVLETEPPDPEEADKRIYSEASGVVKSDGNQLRKKAEAAATKPPEAADHGKPGAGVQPPPKN